MFFAIKTKLTVNYNRGGAVAALFHSWWFILAFFVGLAFYSRGVTAKEELLQTLMGKKNQLLLAKHQALELQECLRLEIASQNDPAYIELALMRELGVIPEGQIKVYFEE